MRKFKSKKATTNLTPKK